MDLAEVFTGALSWRRLLVLTRQLPASSRLARAADPRSAWTTTDYLVAQAADNTMLVADELASFRWHWLRGNMKKGEAKKLKRPEPRPRIPRPGQQPGTAPAAAKPPRMSPSDAIRLGAARTRGGAR